MRGLASSECGDRTQFAAFSKVMLPGTWVVGRPRGGCGTADCSLGRECESEPIGRHPVKTLAQRRPEWKRVLENAFRIVSYGAIPIRES